MPEDDRRRIVRQGPLDDLPRIDGGAVDRAADRPPVDERGQGRAGEVGEGAAGDVPLLPGGPPALHRVAAARSGGEQDRAIEDAEVGLAELVGEPCGGDEGIHGASLPAGSGRRGAHAAWYASDQEQAAWAELFRHFLDAGVSPFEVQEVSIRDDGFALWESMAINLYLAAKHNKDGFLPASLEDQAICHQWSFWGMTEVERPLLTILIDMFMTAPDKRKPEGRSAFATGGAGGEGGQAEAPVRAGAPDPHAEGAEVIIGPQR